MREFFKRRGIPAIIVSCEGIVVLVLLVIVLVKAGTRGLSDKVEPADMLVADRETKNFSFVAEVDSNVPDISSSELSASLTAEAGSEMAKDEGVSEEIGLAAEDEIDIDVSLTPMGAVAPEPVNEFTEAIRERISSMSVEDKVSQLFIVTPEDFTGSLKVSVAGTMTKAAVENYAVGGFVYSNANYWDDNQASMLLFGIRELILDRSGVPCFIFVEGKDETGEAFLTLSFDEYDDAMIDIISGRIQNIAYDDDELFSFYGFLSEADDPDLHPVNVMFDCDEVNAVPALLGGADMLYVRNGFAKIYNTVFDAILNGDLPIETVDDALMRIYSYKLMSEE